MSISPSQLHKTLDVGAGTRVIIVGDVHGCLELKLLMSVVNFNHTQDKLILLGDLVNKGPNSTGVISFMRELKDTAFAVRGNHDEAALFLRRRCHRLRQGDGRSRRKGCGTTQSG